MAIVYRVETKETGLEGVVGMGAYLGSNVGYTLAEGNNSNHPCPQDDPKLGRQLYERAIELRGGDVSECQESMFRSCPPMCPTFVCCFRDVDTMLRWFTGLESSEVVHYAERDGHRIGHTFVIRAYRTDDFMHGTFQSLMNKHTCEPIESYPLDHYVR